jgi:hypothetical protein
MLAVLESAKVINPLITVIANGVSNSINSIFNLIEANKYSKKNQFQNLLNALKLEYPYESEDYLRIMANDHFKK